MTHVTCRLTAKNRDQPRNPTLGNRVRAACTFDACRERALSGVTDWLVRSADGRFEVSFRANVLIEPNGNVMWVPCSIYKSSCTIDVEYFPFDEQRCNMSYGSWTYDGNEVKLNPYTPNFTKVDRAAFDSRNVFTARCYASAVLAMGLCPSVSVSVTSRCSIETDERIDLGFVWPASLLPPVLHCVKRKFVYLPRHFLWNFVLNFGLRKFRHGISIVEMCYQISSRKVDAQSVINWAVVGQLSL